MKGRRNVRVKVEVERNRATTGTNNKPLKVDEPKADNKPKVKKPKADNKVNKDLKLDLTNVPRRSQTHLLYDWKNSVDVVVPYQYKDKKGNFVIVAYEMNRKARKNKLKIYDKSTGYYYELDSTTFRDSKFKLK